MIKLPISIVILTLNEEIHIKRAIKNVMDWANDIVVLDSGSTDSTCTIAKELGARVFYRKFDNYSNQRNHAMKSIDGLYDWILFLDADELLSQELKDEIGNIFTNKIPDDIDGFYMKRRNYFMGRWIKYGGYYPIWILRLFRREKASINREMNEHIDVQGKTLKLLNDFSDENLNGLDYWLNKHNKYSTFEALELLKEDSNKSKQEKDFAKLNGSQAQQKRWIREKIWNKLPLFIRPFLYFLYRYFLKLGFLDGVQGFIFHFYHGLVFYILVDAKYWQIKNKKLNK